MQLTPEATSWWGTACYSIQSFLGRDTGGRRGKEEGERAWETSQPGLFSFSLLLITLVVYCCTAISALLAHQYTYSRTKIGSLALETEHEVIDRAHTTR